MRLAIGERLLDARNYWVDRLEEGGDCSLQIFDVLAMCDVLLPKSSGKLVDVCIAYTILRGLKEIRRFQGFHAGVENDDLVVD